MLPAAASLKEQGANNGATAAFLISTPESGVDSISITWALLDPIMTIARPLSAFITAFIAGVSENLMNPPRIQPPGLVMADTSHTDHCCDDHQHNEEHSAPSSLEKVILGINYAAKDIWGDLAGWFFIGILLAGIISAVVPDELISAWLGGGLSSMLIMLILGIPLYICASASTPIAAAFILKGVSPGAALVFLLVGPATNITSLSVLLGILGKRATILFLVTISVVSVICGLAVDQVYSFFSISAQASVGQAAELLPDQLKIGATILLLLLSIPHLFNWLKKRFKSNGPSGCDCGSDSCATDTSSDDKSHPQSSDSCSCDNSHSQKLTILPMAPLVPAGSDKIQIPSTQQSFICGVIKTDLGNIPQVTSELTAKDRRGTFLARWNIGRMHFIVEPGVYALGNPTPESPVLVTANYKMSFDVLRSSLPSRNVWLLVLDTNGINVWCAAGKGTFGTDELCDRIAISGLSKIVSHNQIVLPQLGGPGVDGFAVKKHTGFKVIWGPVMAHDLPRFLENGCKATELMRRKLFPFKERLALVPVEFVQATVKALPFIFLFFILSGLSGEQSFWTNAMEHIPVAVLSIFGGIAAGTIMVPALLPWLPGRALSVKGFFAGIVTILFLLLITGRLIPESPAGIAETLSWLLLVSAISSWLGMNFTGATTYTSRSGVRKEMLRAIPIQFAAAVSGFICWLGSSFYF